MELHLKLQEIGFSEYEAKTYLALLKDYPSTGYQISKNSGVPRSMVYEVLSRLHARGAVLETIEGRVTYYRPLPPEILLNQFHADIQNIISNLRPVLAKYYENQDDNRVWTLVGQDAIFAYCNQLFELAEKEVYLVINDDALIFLENPLKSLLEKNIQPNILLTGSKTLNFGVVAYHPPLESEIQGLTDTLLLIVDNKEVLVASITDQSRATITRNASLILIAKQFIWMEFFTQRIFSKIGDDLLARLDPEDKKIFLSIVQINDQEQN